MAEYSPFSNIPMYYNPNISSCKEENGNIYKKTPIGLCPISAGSAAMLRFQKCSRPHPVPFSCPPLNTLLTLYAADGEKFTGLFG
jgi:hypothetical protein